MGEGDNDGGQIWKTGRRRRKREDRKRCRGRGGRRDGGGPEEVGRWGGNMGGLEAWRWRPPASAKLMVGSEGSTRAFRICHRRTPDSSINFTACGRSGDMGVLVLASGV
ncbi:hypothetical protein NL676_018645 [Syzygium grande]|nr:hypothetical protein NL676_018645 [Syzygium grande]